MPNIFEQSPEGINVFAAYGSIDSGVLILTSWKFFLVLSLFFKCGNAQVIFCFIAIFKFDQADLMVG